MEIRFKNKTLPELCEKRVAAVRKLGDVGARKLQSRLADVEAAEKVADLRAGRPHPLTGDRLGQFAVDLSAGWRLVLAPANEPIPRRDDASVDWSRVTIVSIEYIGDYHD